MRAFVGIRILAAGVFVRIRIYRILGIFRILKARASATGGRLSVFDIGGICGYGENCKMGESKS